MIMLGLLASSGGDTGTVAVDDVFSAFTYTGNGAAQTINNGIDLAGKGGLVWTKQRTANLSSPNHILFDTSNGTTKNLSSNTTSSAQVGLTDEITAFNSNGYSLGNDTAHYEVNRSGENYVSWTFRKSAKFFDVVTFTNNNSGTLQSISHSLGVAPGLIIVKNVNASGNWWVWHRGMTSNNYYMKLNLTDAESNGGLQVWDSTSSSFSVHRGIIGANTNTYVAYLFAHDTSTDGIIQCGSFTTDGSGNATVNLGWEPQYLMTKSSSAANDWWIRDINRGWDVNGNISLLKCNLSSAETQNSGYGKPTASGFTISGYNSNATFIYLAIRRSNKPPTTGTQVYNAIARTGTGAAATVTGVGFAPDFMMAKMRSAGASGIIFDRLRGSNSLYPDLTNAEGTNNISSFDMDGVTLIVNPQSNSSGQTYINHFFKRAKEVFDIVCYTGTGSSTTVAHGLGVVPELMIVKKRNGVSNWWVFHNFTNHQFELNLPNPEGTASFFGNNTSNVIDIVNSTASSSGQTYVAYLFASKAGISKVGSYTGNGTSQTINMGFTTGARFFMAKRTDSTGDWFTFDTTRGIVLANDPHLSLNTTAAEVMTDDSVDPDSTGIIVNQVSATNINVTSASYIYLAFA